VTPWIILLEPVT